MAAFPAYAPSYSAARQATPRWKRARFNDEIEQAKTTDLNPIGYEWTLRWNNLLSAEADEIDAFLEEQAVANLSFDWTPPGGFSEGAYRCSEWRKVQDSCKLKTVEATFRRDFS